MYWSRRTPEEAADWATKLEDIELRAEAMTQVVSIWSHNDLDAAADWLSQFQPSPDIDRPVALLANLMQDANPEQALAWAATITDEQRRETLTEEIVKQWREKDPEGAASLLDR